jgi:hypothetical protein
MFRLFGHFSVQRGIVGQAEDVAGAVVVEPVERFVETVAMTAFKHM